MEYTCEADDCDSLRRQVLTLELRLSEANHRIANSLQMASLLAGGGARDVPDPVARSRLIATQSYIEAIAGVHQLLCDDHSNGRLPLDVYVAKLVGRLRTAAALDCEERTLSLRTESVEAPPEWAGWIGMALIELISNAWKYAYAAKEPGEVRVTLERRARGFALQVEDDGPGFDPDGPASGSGLGTRMISAMARRMGAEFRYENGGGARAILVARSPCGARDD